jgi:ABC-type antimicrobial peptide transport system permease subunit
MFKNNIAKMLGVINVEDMIDREISVNNMTNLKIVGITDLKNPSIYMDESLFINVLANTDESFPSDIVDYTLYQNKIELKEGRFPTEDYEVIVNINRKDEYKLNKTIDTTINDTKLKVVGYYFSPDNYDYYFVNNNMIKYQLIKNKENIIVYSDNKEEAISSFHSENINILDSYEQSKKEYLNDRKEDMKSSIIFSLIIILISFIEIFLMIRSSFLSRIKEIGIYRAIGVKKSDIYKMFISEIFAITTLTSIPGILFMAYVLKQISNISYFSETFLINSTIVIISIICIYLFNFIIGLLPVFSLMRKRPAEILSRTDLE